MAAIKYCVGIFIFPKWQLSNIVSSLWELSGRFVEDSYKKESKVIKTEIELLHRHNEN